MRETKCLRDAKEPRETGEREREERDISGEQSLGTKNLERDERYRPRDTQMSIQLPRFSKTDLHYF